MIGISKPDPINELKPGEALSIEGKAALAKANLEETNKAHKMAANHRAEDARNEPPLETALAGSIKEKLEALPVEPGAPTQSPE